MSKLDTKNVHIGHTVRITLCEIEYIGHMSNLSYLVCTINTKNVDMHLMICLKMLCLLFFK